MNALIQQIVQNGLAQDVYGAVNTSGMIISLLYSLWHSHKLGVPVWKSVIILAAVVECMSITQSGILQVLLYISKVNFMGITTTVNSIVRVIMVIPLCGFLLAKLLRLKWSHVCDAVAMYPLLTSGIGQLACVFTGCCHGYECSWGIYSMQTGAYHFPVQVLETVVTLVIFVFLARRTKRKQYISDGTLFPLMMILYGAMRFGCELLRDNEKIFLGSSAMGIHAAIMCVVGMIVLERMRRKKGNAPQVATEENKE